MIYEINEKIKNHDINYDWTHSLNPCLFLCNISFIFVFSFEKNADWTKVESKYWLKIFWRLNLARENKNCEERDV